MADYVQQVPKEIPIQMGRNDRRQQAGLYTPEELKTEKVREKWYVREKEEDVI